MIQEEGGVLDLCARSGRTRSSLCIQRSFEQSLKVHIPLIEIFYPQLKNYIKTYDLNLVEILINGIEIT